MKTIIIARNEGERLRSCLCSLSAQVHVIIYVDSGSTDDSVELARSCGSEVVELDMSKPFTAARARNAGFRRLAQLHTDAEYVQFIDGDCEMADGWLDKAAEVLDERPDIAIVCGRLHEKHPDRSIYNRLCDMEWNTPTGEVQACGGIFCIRASAFREAGGFDDSLIAGEEPELCVRLRQKGWKILRIDADMAYHDAAMKHFSQWWKRCVRGGYAYAEGAHLHGAPPERHYVREVRSALFWGAALPASMIASLAGIAYYLSFGCWLGLAAFAYIVLGYRIFRWRRRSKDSRKHSALYAAFCILAKWPQFYGITLYAWRKLLSRQSSLIEYKHAPSGN